MARNVSSTSRAWGRACPARHGRGYRPARVRARASAGGTPFPPYGTRTSQPAISAFARARTRRVRAPARASESCTVRRSASSSSGDRYMMSGVARHGALEACGHHQHDGAVRLEAQVVGHPSRQRLAHLHEMAPQVHKFFRGRGVPRLQREVAPDAAAFLGQLGHHMREVLRRHAARHLRGDVRVPRRGPTRSSCPDGRRRHTGGTLPASSPSTQSSKKKKRRYTCGTVSNSVLSKMSMMVSASSRGVGFLSSVGEVRTSASISCSMWRSFSRRADPPR